MSLETKIWTDLKMKEKDMPIDLGGTPDNVLAQDKDRIAYGLGYKPEQLVIILDPIDLARQSRTIELGDFPINRIKFEVRDGAIMNMLTGEEEDGVRAGGTTDFSAEKAPPPLQAEVQKRFELAKPKVIGNLLSNYEWKTRDGWKESQRRYDEMAARIASIAGTAPNMREFMNSVVAYLFSPIKTIRLEEVFAKNPNATRYLIEVVKKVGWDKKEITKDEGGNITGEVITREYKIPARAVCPLCNLFVDSHLGEELNCCGVPADEIIASGKFIPEWGFLPILTYLNEYRIFTREGKDYINTALKLMKELGAIKEGDTPFVLHPSEAKVAKFESKLVDGLVIGKKNK